VDNFISGQDQREKEYQKWMTRLRRYYMQTTTKKRMNAY
jgi:hypothetical protein